MCLVCTTPTLHLNSPITGGSLCGLEGETQAGLMALPPEARPQGTFQTCSPCLDIRTRLN